MQCDQGHSDRVGRQEPPGLGSSPAQPREGAIRPILQTPNPWLWKFSSCLRWPSPQGSVRTLLAPGSPGSPGLPSSTRPSPRLGAVGGQPWCLTCFFTPAPGTGPARGRCPSKWEMNKHPSQSNVKRRSRCRGWQAASMRLRGRGREIRGPLPLGTSPLPPGKA